MFAGNKAFAELKGKWGMGNGDGKGEKKWNLFFISRERSSIIQTRMVRGDVFCLTGGCQSRPGVFQLVQASNYGDESAKNTYHAIGHLRYEDINN